MFLSRLRHGITCILRMPLISTGPHNRRYLELQPCPEKKL